MNGKASKRVRLTYVNIVRYDRKISFRAFKREYTKSRYHNRRLPKGLKNDSHSVKIKFYKRVL